MFTIHQLFDDSLANRMVSTAITICGAPDKLDWDPSLSVRVKSGDLYKLYKPNLMDGRDNAWVRKIAVHPRLVLFLWNMT